MFQILMAIIKLTSSNLLESHSLLFLNRIQFPDADSIPVL